MILRPENRSVLSGNPGPLEVYEVLDEIVKDGRKLSAEKNKRIIEARERLETGQVQPQEPVLPEEGDLVEQVETPQIAALQGNFREFIERNPSERMIEAWIKTHRVD